MALGPVYTRSVDWWSTGMFLMQCMDRDFNKVKVPFSWDNIFGSGKEAFPQKVAEFIVEMQARRIAGEPVATDLMRKLLAPVAERLDVVGIMHHEFFHPLKLPFHDVEGEQVWSDHDVLRISPPWKPPVDGPNDLSMEGGSDVKGMELVPDAKPCGAPKLLVAGYTMARDGLFR
mmetsp:Transcript_27343/g.61754  ORF Transcript_27343/g.61754 Transcript_27343/m.61754 type:complete len:174 (+) Transcript_27343:794-1315(+)